MPPPLLLLSIAPDRVPQAEGGADVGHQGIQAARWLPEPVLNGAQPGAFDPTWLN